MRCEFATDERACRTRRLISAETARVLITRHGKVVAALVSPGELSELDRAQAGSGRGTILQLTGLDGKDAFTHIVDEVVRNRGLPRPLHDLE